MGDESIQSRLIACRKAKWATEVARLRGHKTIEQPDPPQEFEPSGPFAEAIKARWAKIRAKRLNPGVFPEEGERSDKHNCLRCGNWWDGRSSFNGDRGLPKRCPSCRSPL